MDSDEAQDDVDEQQDEELEPPDEELEPPDEELEPPDEGLEPPDEGLEPPGEEVNIHLRNEEGNHFRWRDFFARNLLPRRHGEINNERNWLVRRFLQRGEPDSDDDDNESSNASDSEMPESFTFDTNLPASHSYLGEMQECSGAAFQDQATYQTLHVLYVYDFILFPNQTIALQFSRLNEISMIRNVMQQPDKTFGIMMQKYNSFDASLHTRDLYNFGCTAEIRSFQDEEGNESNTLRVVVIGRQKFKLMEKRRQIDGNILGKIKIITDVDLPELRNSVGIHSKCMVMHHSHSSPTVRDGSSLVNKPLQNNFYKKWSIIRHAAYSTAWPSWIYRMYDVSYLRLKIFNEMREWNQKLQEHQCPEGATDFSYWVITKFPLSDEWRLHLLSLNSAVQRLRCELLILRKCFVLVCSDCSHQIADRKDAFSMSVSGTMAAYVNPGGVVHETLTLRKVTGLIHVGQKSTEHSWFPGYAWKICNCSNCGQHMGWKFTATSTALKPKMFWGLTRASLSPRMPSFQEANETSLDSDISLPEIYFDG